MMDRKVDITTTLWFECALCGGPLEARMDREVITVGFCQRCRDDTDKRAYDQGYADGEASQP